VAKKTLKGLLDLRLLQSAQQATMLSISIALAIDESLAIGLM
jgi:hypothetical protein